MVCIASASVPNPRWHQAFLAMLPQIITHAKCAFHYLKPEAKAEAVQEVVCNALKAFVRLQELGKADLAYANVLARYAVKQTRDHRKVGGNLNVRDVLSKYCQARKNIVVEQLDRYDADEKAWSEVLVEDRRAGPADTACVRLDFSDWLDSLKRRDRRIAESLAAGNRTRDVARRFKISAGRISQLRRQLAESWRRFVGDEPGGAAAAA